MLSPSRSADVSGNSKVPVRKVGVVGWVLLLCGGVGCGGAGVLGAQVDKRD